MQYKVIQAMPEELEDELNASAGEGYELIAALPNPDGGVTAIMEFDDSDGDDEDEEDEDEEEEI